MGYRLRSHRHAKKISDQALRLIPPPETSLYEQIFGKKIKLDLVPISVMPHGFFLPPRYCPRRYPSPKRIRSGA